jgi:hypothetical protein
MTEPKPTRFLSQRKPTEMESAYAAQILKMVEEASPGFLERLIASVRKFAAAFERLPAETQARLLVLAEKADDAHEVEEDGPECMCRQHLAAPVLLTYDCTIHGEAESDA